MNPEQNAILNPYRRPACIGADEAATIFGWPAYFIPLLMRAGHLKPLGKPAQNARKWFASVELERLSHDAAWLDKAVRIVEKYMHDSNKKKRSKGSVLASLSESNSEPQEAAAA